jgi:catechol 2,3-dioxygenase-like lactoylglutathione lyase family enzyme
VKDLAYIAPVLRVADLDRATAFYCERLGFKLEFCYDNFYASVCRDGCRIHLSCASPAARDQAAFERAEHIDACLGVADAKACAIRTVTSWDSSSRRIERPEERPAVSPVELSFGSRPCAFFCFRSSSA